MQVIVFPDERNQRSERINYIRHVIWEVLVWCLCIPVGFDILDYTLKFSWEKYVLTEKLLSELYNVEGFTEILPMKLFAFRFCI